MAAVSAERDPAKMFRGSESCSVCLDAVNDSGERSIAKLKCGHHFHLDCIGSAFNAKGAMQCPNCRHVENGQWLYANGSRWNDDFPFEEISYEDDYEVYQTTLSPFLSHRAEALNHFEFCPYGHLGLTSGGSAYEPFQMAMLRDIDVPVSRIRSTGRIDLTTTSPQNHLSQAVNSSAPSRQSVRSGPEVVVNVSYNYPDGGIASVPLPLSPYHDGQARQSQGTEESRLRQPVPPVGSTRPLDPSGASNSGSSIGSFGSLIGDGGDGLNSGRSIWGPNRDRYHQSPFSGYSRTDHTSIFTDQTRFSPTMDRSSPMMDLLSRDRAPLHGDTGSGPVAHERSTSRLLNEAHAFERSNSRLLNEAHAHERSTSRLLNESQRVTNHILGTLSAHGHNESYMEGFNGQGPQGPCPFRRLHGQVGNSQSQPQSSSFHSATAPIGSSRRSRQNGNGIRASPSTSGGGRNGENGWELGSIGEPSSRRASQTCPNLSLSLGPEPTVPGLESHGSGYRNGGQGFVPWARRDNNPSGPSSSPWSPGQLWHPPTLPSPGQQPNRFSYSDYLEGHGTSQHGTSQHGPSQHGSSQHGSSQHGSSQHGPTQHGPTQHGPTQHPILQELVDQSSLFSTFGTDPAGVGGSIRNQIPSPTPYSISLRPPSPPVRWCT